MVYSEKRGEAQSKGVVRRGLREFELRYREICQEGRVTMDPFQTFRTIGHEPEDMLSVNTKEDSTRHTTKSVPVLTPSMSLLSEWLMKMPSQRLCLSLVEETGAAHEPPPGIAILTSQSPSLPSLKLTYPTHPAHQQSHTVTHSLYGPHQPKESTHLFVFALNSIICPQDVHLSGSVLYSDIFPGQLRAQMRSIGLPSAGSRGATIGVGAEILLPRRTSGSWCCSRWSGLSFGPQWSGSWYCELWSEEVVCVVKEESWLSRRLGGV